MNEDKADIESRRIKAGLCPKCGERAKDKGSYVRCVSCDWSVTNGVYSESEGYSIQYSEDED